MDAGKVLETLGGDSVEFKMGESQSCHDETLEQVSVLTTLSVECTGSELATEGPEKANRGNFGVNDQSVEAPNPGKESDFGYWNDGLESMGAEIDMESHEGGAVAVENETEGGASLVWGTREVGVGSDGNGMDGSGVSLIETGHDGNKSDEQVGVEAIRLGEIDPATRVDGGISQIGEEGISLIVEVFGPLNGTCQRDNMFCETEHMLEEGASECTPSSTRNGHEERVANPTEEDTTDNQEHKFCVGDLVWAKTKTEVWWPGMVSDPTAASKDAAKSDQRDCFLVKYFGSIISVKCSASRLKPFIEYFEQMSQQNKSRSFVGAVDKALLEIGQRIKLEMSCSCSLKETETTDATPVHPISKDITTGGLGFFSASVFEPEKFMESIRYKALDISMPGSIEFAVMKNCLSAFYGSLGHKQLPMYKLRPRNDANGGNDAKDSALHGLGLERTGEELNKLFGDSNLPLGCNMNERETKISAEKVNKTPKGKHEKSFELRERKKSKYLSYPYVNSWEKKDSAARGGTETEDPKGDSNAAVDTKNTSEQPEVPRPSGNSSGKNPRKKSRKSRTFKSIYGKVENIDTSSTEMLQELQLTALECFYPSESKDSSSVLNFFYGFRKHSFLNHDFTSEDICNHKEGIMNKETSGHQEIDAAKGSEGDKLQLAPSSVEPKRRRRKQKEALNQTCPDNAEKGKVRRKRKKMETASPGHPEIRVIGGLPDLNGNSMSLSVENMEVTGPDTSKGKLEPKRAKNKEVFVSEASTATDTKSSEVQNVNRSTKFIPVLKDVHGMGAFRVENNLHLSGLSVAVKPEPKKRKRKEKASDLQNSPSAIPDLNGNATNHNSTAKGLPDPSAVTPQGQPQQNRTESDIGGATGSTGNTLLLNFTPGHPLPSKESLNEAFIRFGPVVEPGTQFVGGSCAQVVFAQSCDAEVAYKSLETSPFGPALASYHLNRCPAATNSTGKGLADLSAITSQEKPRRRRRRRNTPNDGITTGNILILNFTPGHPLPSKESLNDTFIKFGPVVEAETKFSSDTTAQIVFARSSDAEGACQSLGNSSPFGPALASYHLANTSQEKPRRRKMRRTTPNVVRTTGNTLILNFTPGHPLPSTESLNDTFIKFGPVVEAETKFLSDTTAQVVFAKSSDAEGACQSLGKSSPFGPALASYHLHCRPGPAADNSKMPTTLLPMDAFKFPMLPSGKAPTNGEAPDLMYIKQNLEMMTAMLEKAGDNISPDMKAKLEGEVKGFLKKVSAMVGTSSSSS
nr:serine/threonine-protein kinase ATM isoform X3 [Ipomoea batatas]